MAGKLTRFLLRTWKLPQCDQTLPSFWWTAQRRCHFFSRRLLPELSSSFQNMFDWLPHLRRSWLPELPTLKLTKQVRALMNLAFLSYRRLLPHHFIIFTFIFSCWNFVIIAGGFEFFGETGSRFSGGRSSDKVRKCNFLRDNNTKHFISSVYDNSSDDCCGGAIILTKPYRFNFCVNKALLLLY